MGYRDLSSTRHPIGRPTRRLAVAGAVAALVLAMIPAGVRAAPPETASPAPAATPTVTPVVTPETGTSAAKPHVAHQTIQLDLDPVRAKIAAAMERPQTLPARSATPVKPANAKPVFKPATSRPAVARLVVTPPSAEVKPGLSQPYAAQALDAQGRLISDVTPMTTFTIDGLPCAGRACSSPKPGVHAIEAVYGKIKATATLTVSADDVAQPAAGSAPAATAPSTAVMPAAAGSTHVRGRVTNESGAGLAGISVTANDGTTSPMPRVTTDASGHYDLGVTPGQYQVGFYDFSMAYIGGYYSDGGLVWKSTEATSFVVAAADVELADVALPIGVHITGRVTNEAGVGLPAVGAWAVSPDADPNSFGGGTDGQGYYSVIVPGDGDYRMSFWAGTSYAHGWYADSGFMLSELTATEIHVGATTISGIDVTLPSIVAISGRVTNAAGDGLAGIQVTAVAVTYYGGWTEQTAADGTYTLNVADGDYYTIQFVDGSDQYAIGYYVAGGWAAHESEADQVYVGAGGLAGLNVVMPAKLDLQGTVKGSGGAGLPNIEVIVFDPYQGYLAADRYTDAAGHWSARVDPGMSIYYYDSTGRYGSGYLGAGDTFTYDLSAAKAITAGNSDISAVDIVLPPSLHVRGTVTGPGSAKLAGIAVDVYDASSYVDVASGTTDVNGDYSIVVTPGLYVVGFYDPTGTYPSGYWIESGFTPDFLLAGTVDVTDADVPGINVQMPVGHHISGMVSNTQTAPLADIEVALFNSIGDLIAETYTGIDGSYFFLVPQGGYYIGYLDGSYTYAMGFWDGSGFTPDASTMSEITVSGDVSNLDVTMPLSLSEPLDVTAVAGDHSATVSWTEPLHDGGMPITTYTVVNQHDDRICTWAGGPLTCTVTGLSAGTSYEFYVYAETIAMYGPLSSPSNAVTPMSLPGAPSRVSAVGVSSTAVISWTAAAANGSPITKYTATVNPGGLQCTTTGALNCTVGGLNSTTVYSVTVTATNASGTGPASSPAVSFTPRVGATYVGLTPSRLVNTALGIGLPGKIVSHVAATFQVTGLAPGDPYRNVPADATAVTGFVSVSGATAKGWLALTPEPNDNPITSTLNFPAGDKRSTGVTVPLGAGGKLSVTYGAILGPTVLTDVIFDVTGYFVTNSSGSTYTALTPNRLVDSRPTGSGHTNTGITTGKLASGMPKTFVVVNRTPGVTATNVPVGAVAVTGTLTVTGQTTAGYLSLGPDVLSSPPTTSLFFPTGDNRATGVTIKLSNTGTLGVTFTGANSAAKTDVVFDVTGFFMPDSSGATYVPVTPNRVLDSRPTGGVIVNAGFLGKIKNRVAATFTVVNRTPGVTATNVPVGAVAVTGTLTVTGQTKLGYLALTNNPTNNPTTSTLNFPAGDNRATGVTVPLSSAGRLSVTYVAVAGATTNVIFDVSGYFLN